MKFEKGNILVKVEKIDFNEKNSKEVLRLIEKENEVYLLRDKKVYLIDSGDSDFSISLLKPNDNDKRKFIKIVVDFLD